MTKQKIRKKKKTYYEIITEGIAKNSLVDNFYPSQQSLYNYIYPFLTQYPLQDDSENNRENLLYCFLQNISNLKKVLYFINKALIPGKDYWHRQECSLTTENNIYTLLNALCEDRYFSQLYKYLKIKPTKDYHHYNYNSITNFITAVFYKRK